MSNTGGPLFRVTIRRKKSGQTWFKVVPTIFDAYRLEDYWKKRGCFVDHEAIE